MILANEDILACLDLLATTAILVQEAKRVIVVKSDTGFLVTLAFLALLANEARPDLEETDKEEQVDCLGQGGHLDRQECRELLDHKEFVTLLIVRCGIRVM